MRPRGNTNNNNNYNGMKMPRYIVYPSNSEYNVNSIDQANRRYDKVSSTGMYKL